MTSYTINLVIRIIIATVFAVILGNGSVVAFNHFPQKWFEDWNPDESGDNLVRILPPKLLAADNAGRQRLPSTPWKYAFTAMFGAAGVYLAIGCGVQYEIAVLLLMAIVLEMAISDQLYKVVPDQLQVLLAVSSIGFVSYNEKWWEPLAGAGIGLALSLSILGLGLLIFKTGSIGGADIKFYVGIGLVTGRAGVIVIFILTTLLFAIQGVVITASGRGSIKDSNPMMPAAFAATTVYLLFLYNTLGSIQL